MVFLTGCHLPVSSIFWLHNRLAKDKVGLSLANLLYGRFIVNFRSLVPAMGGGSGQDPSQGVGAAGVSAGHFAISGLLQAVAAAGHGGIGPGIYGAGGRAAAAGGGADGGVESGVELVLQDGTFRWGTRRQRHES